jgi:hypothetical protein
MFTPLSRINISSEKLTLFIQGIVKGLPIRIACDKAGIPVYYYYKWLKMYNEFITRKENIGDVFNDIEELEPKPIIDAKTGKPILDSKGEYIGYTFTPISMIANVKKGFAEWVEMQSDKIDLGGQAWQSAAWLLERRVKDEYSKEEPTNKEVKQVDAIKVIYVDPSKDKERLAKLQAQVEESIK